jgi:hypothetical protein
MIISSNGRNRPQEINVFVRRRVLIGAGISPWFRFAGFNPGELSSMDNGRLKNSLSGT